MSVDLPFDYRIRRSQRASRARIVVKPGQVEIVAPLQIPERDLHRFVQAKQAWVSQTLRKMSASSSQQHSFVPTEFRPGAEMAYQGKPYPLLFKQTKLKRIKVEFTEGYVLSIPETMAIEQQQAEIRQAVIKWLKKQTKNWVEQIVGIHAAKKQLFPRTITIKTQRSRWGSCGIHNDININWLLLMAPKDVLEYVVVHELCHIKVKNHSSQFWALVGQHLPDYQQRRQWLKKHGRSLMLAFNLNDKLANG